MFKRSVLTLMLVGSLLACTANADQASIKSVLSEKFPNADISSITKTPYSGLYEVIIDGQIVYTDENATYVFLGSVVDIKSKRNLTNERMAKLNAIKIDELPFEQAIKFVKGNGSRKLVVFSDPQCPFCKKFEQELTKVDNITIYLFPYPIASLHPQSTAEAKAIWCAPDKNAAWQNALLKNTAPKNSGDCKNPVDANIALGNKLHITGTPTLIFANGERVPGMVPAEKLEQLLNEKK
ncbi:DsbC family protein [Sulfuriferula nivalis]|uniref:Thiol:disulfide interchange protein n=1 Tax=Sulfuriferula nivalis TaxID=2675298 RepID=A0A809RMI6_9PROT|nr:DsbC family protein [Sulfuriferula nivalis]BBP02004.1 thiol:disulfide interchange protein DsbC [Sulfuriferula nivalis]